MASYVKRLDPHELAHVTFSQVVAFFSTALTAGRAQAASSLVLDVQRKAYSPVVDGFQERRTFKVRKLP